MLKKIVIKGAKEHNLKNITLEIPKEKFVVITGLSGSGKSSLAFDTVYAKVRDVMLKAYQLMRDSFWIR